MQKITTPEQLDEERDHDESVEVTESALAKPKNTGGRPRKSPTGEARVGISVRVLPITDQLIRAEAKRCGISNGEVIDRLAAKALKLAMLLVLAVAAFGAEPVNDSWKRAWAEIMRISDDRTKQQEAAALRWADSLVLNEVQVPDAGPDARPSEVEANKKATWANCFIRDIKQNRDARNGHEIIQLMSKYDNSPALKFFDEITGNGGR